MDQANLLIDNALTFLGVTQASDRHRQIIDGYNLILPRPVGYPVKYSDDWCDAFVTYIADISGLTHLIGRECGVQRHLDIFKSMGIWQNKLFPRRGDIVVFDWDTNGWADHIGFVEKVDGNQITTIEGNSNGRVARNTFAWTDRRIQGYARPQYETEREMIKTIDEIAQEVVAGRWSQGQERISRLIQAGYDAVKVQARVNEKMLGLEAEAEGRGVLVYDGAELSDEILLIILGLAESYDVLPSLLVVMLHFEGLWGQSNVARSDNNWAGMTWSASYVGHPEIKKTRGSARPVNEGGHYIRYESVEDFLIDWVYLLRKDGSYRVVGQRDFAAAVAGLFKVGGASYDYAGVGYQAYLRGMESRYQAIDLANSGRLQEIDEEFLGKLDIGLPMIKVGIRPEAERWQSGQRIPDWVKDLSFDILDDKDVEVSQTAYLLGNQGVPIGWLWEKDLAGA